MSSQDSSMTVGDVRKAIAGLPDSATVHPEWSDFPGDDDPAVRLDFIRAVADADGPYLSIGVSLVRLDEIEDDEDDDDEDFACSDSENEG